MTTVVYILLHLDNVLNELFSRLFIFFYCNYQSFMASSQTFKLFFSKQRYVTYTAVALSASIVFTPKCVNYAISRDIASGRN
jgi:hypothetical protein